MISVDDEGLNSYQNFSECGANLIPNINNSPEPFEKITVVNALLYLASGILAIIVVASGVNSYQR